ncbi:hypothetical protein CRV24_004912 [Beauveria bassiana]|nr:hypothetical protein CRV24_004912 [Beauveria bassiana]
MVNQVIQSIHSTEYRKTAFDKLAKPSQYTFHSSSPKYKPQKKESCHSSKGRKRQTWGRQPPKSPSSTRLPARQPPEGCRRPSSPRRSTPSRSLLHLNWTSGTP